MSTITTKPIGQANTSLIDSIKAILYSHDELYVNPNDIATKLQLFDKVLAENQQLRCFIEILLGGVVDPDEEIHNLSTNKSYIGSTLKMEPWNLHVEEDVHLAKFEEIAGNTLPGPQLVKIAPSDALVIKEEETGSCLSSSSFLAKYEEDSNEKENESCRFIRQRAKKRNGFKPSKEKIIIKIEDEFSLAKRRRSKAKHLWISYGRKIVEYAVKYTKGEQRKKIRVCDKKLESKKGYSEVFRIRNEDSRKDIDFKLTFGRLAIEFIDKEIEDAFLNSNYRDELLSQKGRVKNWISKLITWL